MKKPILIFITAILSICMVNCQKIERDNPWDEKATLDPNEWAPQNFQVEDVSITQKNLSWSFGDKNIEGFKLDRKKGDEPWQEGYQVFDKTERVFSETIELNPDINYHYSLYAFAGANESAKKDTSFAATLPPPQDLTITANSASSITLNWSYSLTGHSGFKIERKIDNGNWEMLVDNLNPNQNSYDDSGLDLNSFRYYYRVYAYWAEYSSSKPEESITLIFNCGETLTDTRDGNQYETVQIGNQCWLKENLKWLPSVSLPTSASNTAAYYYVYGYNGTSASAAKATDNYQTWGVLYNWTAALNACPQGWHLPSDSEWTVLTDYLGGGSVAGGKMKTTGTTHWSSPNTGATNSSGFSGLPGGNRFSNGSFYYLGTNGYWWSSTEYSSTDAWRRYLASNSADAYRYYTNKELGFSVRCLRD